MNNWFRVNIDISNCFANKEYLDNLILASIDKGLELDMWSFKQSNNNKLFKDEWIKYLEDIVGLKYNSALVFYRKSNYQHRAAHIDISGDTQDNDRIFALNWILSKPDLSKMRWYKPVDFNNEDMLITPAGTPYLEWPIDQLEEYGDYCTIENIPTICRVDVPHDVEMGTERRISLSIRFDRHLTNWNNVIRHFESKNLII